MLLRCGPFTVLYENGFLRHVKLADNEVLRMIYFALRDENWGTYGVDIEDEKISADNNGFAVTYSAVNRREKKEMFRWSVKIDGSEQGMISMSIEGEATSTLKKNRAGFCVLHPLRDTFNQPVEITHADGTRSSGSFPEFVDPENPFKEIRSMRWRVAEDWYEISFFGDIFETEDQRNWTDASFKTFCTPLRLPFPVELKPGDRVSQKVVFKPVEPLSFRPPTKEIFIRKVAGDKYSLPGIGVSVSRHHPLTMAQASLIGALGFNHLRIDVRLFESMWLSLLQEQLSALSKSNTPLELVLHLGTDAERAIDTLVTSLKELNINVKQVLILSQGTLTTSPSHISLAPYIRKKFEGALIGAGTDHNFTELNRHRFNADTVDFVSFAIDPQEHATDSLTIVENLEAQTDTVRSANKIYARSVHISPVALKRRSNPYATDPAKMDVPQSEQADPRQLTPFCAAWTLGSIKSISLGNANSGTYHQVTGPLGIIKEIALPVYTALKQIQEARKHKVLPCESSHPLVVDALCFDNGNLLIWNYTDKQQSITLPSGKTVEVNAFAHELFTSD